MCTYCEDTPVPIISLCKNIEEWLTLLNRKTAGAVDEILHTREGVLVVPFAVQNHNTH